MIELFSKDILLRKCQVSDVMYIKFILLNQEEEGVHTLNREYFKVKEAPNFEFL